LARWLADHYRERPPEPDWDVDLDNITPRQMAQSLDEDIWLRVEAGRTSLSGGVDGMLGEMHFLRGVDYFHEFGRELLALEDYREFEQPLRDFIYSWEVALDPYLAPGYRRSPIPEIIPPESWFGFKLAAPPWVTAPAEWAPRFACRR
jgi:hypothetical protein